MVPITYNLRSLLVRKTTTSVTVVGIGLVVFVIASSLMLLESVNRTLAQSGSRDKGFVMRKGADAELSSSIDQPAVGLILSAPGVQKDETGAPIGAGEVVVVIALDKVGDPGKVSNVQVRGVTDSVMKLRPETRIVAGRPARPGTDEVIIGRRVRGRFAGLELGGRFELNKNRPVEVVGVFAAGGSAFESEVWADLDTIRSTFGRESLVSSVTVRLESRAKFDAFAATVEHDKQLGLDAVRERTYYERQSEQSSIFIWVMGIGIAVLFSIGAMIGAMITMYGAVSDRRHEIGTLRALGFSRLAILGSFLIESLLFATAGGVLGALASLAMGMVEFSMMNFVTWSEIVFTFEATPGILLFAVLSGGLMGVLGGFFPAVRAAFTSPVQAMRD
jgi:putative ABC transport system permease protein